MQRSEYRRLFFAGRLPEKAAVSGKKKQQQKKLEETTQ